MVLLAGGAGTCLWPFSRKTVLKQFSTLIGNKSLFQASAQRPPSSRKVKFTAPMTLTNFDLILS
jgi:mannose-1-phosphate guanylyltransferase/mannose-6-phosphate isomerase